MEILQRINDVIWNPLVVLALGSGLLFTIATRCLQIRRFKDMISLILHGKSEAGEISSFQALALTLSSRVGVANIAGVATAVAAGGPGALFWMAVVAFLGGATAFIESTLAQIYKRNIDGEVRGGIPYYIERGLRLKPLATLAAIIGLCVYGFFAPGIQSNNIASSFSSAFGIAPWVTGLILVALLGYIIFGRRKRLIRFVEYVVPFMAAGYVLVTLLVLAVNITAIPEALRVIISSAFGQDSVFGGILGSAVLWGVRRGIFSNVAGVGEGTFGAAAARVSHPAEQGLVQCFSIYIDTLVVCMATGVMIVLTGSYNVVTDGVTLVQNLPGVEAGPAFTQTAVDSLLDGFGSIFVAISIALFAFTTLVAFYYICESNLFYIFKSRHRISMFCLRVVLLIMTFFGTVQSADFIWALGDVGYGSLGLVNMICLLFLARPALAALRDYDRQRSQGGPITFVPEELGIQNADYWTQDGKRPGHLDTSDNVDVVRSGSSA
ncbi:alanine/glycine:cation symporter family protein [Carnimonas nigrificans]|uniref:alanine/glycine:cation symporter family protein n=1 Tax=Carnimonas nigrificans TaxID=64323 RepID=UPI000470F716|nr:alanine/glycine:cation symporter family protein [Carnimonas nigrificans]